MKNYLRSKKGWYKEPVRHSLASRGISTSPDKKDIYQGDASPSDFYPIDWFKLGEGDPKEARRVMRLFWWCSITDDWYWFDFDNFFKFSERNINNWIKHHFGQYAKQIEDDGSNIDDVLEWIWEDSLEGELLDDDLPILTLIELKGFGTVESKIEETSYLLEKLNQNSEEMSKIEKISLAEELIHFEHIHESIWGVDVERLRENFEEEYL